MHTSKHTEQKERVQPTEIKKDTDDPMPQEHPLSVEGNMNAGRDHQDSTIDSRPLSTTQVYK